ncbi:MAG TPA: choice-of-anchor Q domain-containing protein [Puia sp.]|nr:choice-of-anchor Q domain-containing protein [Puia sp.]
MRKSLLLGLAAGLFLLACKKDTYIAGSNALLGFSSDSVYFDTLFTSTGSITQQVRVYNPNDQKLLITGISLVGGKNSPFLLNINGSPGPIAGNLTLDANDSLYIFISVYINPDAKPEAFIMQDSIRIDYNGNERFIKLSAWGQNAHFLSNQVIRGNISWNNDLPYVISGSLRVDSNAVLSIGPGCRIYFHANAPLLIDGTLLVAGQAEDSLRVYFNGDRLDQPYASYPGSWPGIYFSPASINNVLQYAVLRNGNQSLVAEGPSLDASPKLLLNQCIIDNSLDAGIYGIQSSIEAVNCLISNCGKNIVIAAGGSYHFIQCTAASFSTPVLLHQYPVLTVSDAGQPGSQLPTGDLQAVFSNCILWGDTGIPDEALLSREGSGSFQVLFDHVILKQQNYPQNADSSALLLNTDPLFMSTDNRKGLYDFHLQAGSPALARGADEGIGVDLDGFIRSAGEQDLGCYERQ